MTKLSQFDLISTTPYYLEKVGHVKAVTLHDIDLLPKKQMDYSLYIQVLRMTREDYIKLAQVDEEKLGEIEAFLTDNGLKLTIFDLITTNPTTLNELILAFNFFFAEEVVYDPKASAFLLYASLRTDEDGNFIEDPVGTVTRNNYDDVTDIILQRCFAKSDEDEEEEEPRFKNEKARKMYERQKAARERIKKQQATANAEFLDLGNIVRHLASRQNGLNMLNIWEMTIYNVYDQFEIERQNVGYELSFRNYSIWGGDEKHKFDIDSWYKSQRSDAEDLNSGLYQMAKDVNSQH